MSMTAGLGCIILGFAFVCLAAEPTVDISDSVNAQGNHDYTVTNKSSQSLTGMIVQVDRAFPRGGKSVEKWFYDSVMNEVQPALLPDRSYTFHLGNDTGDPKPMRIFLEVAIFADGSALGEPEAVRSLWKRREWLFTEYQEALDVADRGMTDPKDRDGAIKALDDLKNEKIHDTSRSIEERKAVATAFDDVAGNLKLLPGTAHPGDTIAQLRKRATDRESAFRQQSVPAQVQGQSPPN